MKSETAMVRTQTFMRMKEEVIGLIKKGQSLSDAADTVTDTLNVASVVQILPTDSYKMQLEELGACDKDIETGATLHEILVRYLCCVLTDEVYNDLEEMNLLVENADVRFPGGKEETVKPLKGKIGEGVDA